MPQLWVVYALTAAVCWGLSYAVSERLIHGGVSIYFLFFVTSSFFLIVSGLYGWYSGDITRSYQLIASKQISWVLLITYFTAIFLGSYAIYFSIAAKNATLASLIEISYPLFTIFFVWAIFQTVNLTLPIIIGAILIFSGVTLISIMG